MIGDSKLYRPIHTKKAELIVPGFVRCFDIGLNIFSIGGESGTGKTEVAEEVQRILFEKYKIRCFLMHIDDYYKTDFHDRDKIRKSTGIIGREEINWKKIKKITNDFKHYEPKIYVQMIYRYIDKVIHMIVPTSTVDIILIEGLYGCYFKKAEYRIYLEGGINDTYEFRKQRRKENPDDKFRQYVLERERNCVVQSKKHSDIIIPFKL